MADEDFSGGITSPGGFAFGVQGWRWGEPKVKGITFFLDNTALVSDQYGRPIKGSVIDGKEVKFAMSPPPGEIPDGADIEVDPTVRQSEIDARKSYASHAKVVEALESERIEWMKLPMAGWPQLPYDKLKQLLRVPRTPLEELEKIRDSNMRRDALRMWYERRAEREAAQRQFEAEAEKIRQEAQERAEAAVKK